MSHTAELLRRLARASGGTTGAVFVVFATVMGVSSLVTTMLRGWALPGIALVFIVFIAIGEFTRVSLPGGRDAAPLGAAVALSYAFVTDFGGDTVDWRAYQVVSVVLLGIVIGVAPLVAARRTPSLDRLARRLLVITLPASLVHSSWGRDVLGPLDSWRLALALVAIAAATILFDALLAAIIRATDTHAPFFRVLVDEVRALTGIGVAIAATGVLIALSTGIMGFWALPVFGVPLLLCQFSFRRYAAVRATYRQTIRALSRVTDVGGYTEAGHARRVCDLSLAVGRELGLSEADLLDLEYAALMHDIGQLSLAEPIDRGATTRAAPDDQRRLAESGAEVIRQTGVLDRVADIVARQAEPYRRPGESTDETLPMASRIVRVVNAFDDLTAGSTIPAEQAAGLEHLRLAMAYDYDPRVVATLSRVVERGGALTG